MRLLTALLLFSLCAPAQTANSLLETGNQLSGQSKWREAVEAYTRAIQLQPDLAEAYRKRGIAWRELNQARTALQDFHKAVELAPDNARAYMGRAGAYSDLDDRLAALADYDKAIELDPSYTNAIYARADLLRRMRPGAAAGAAKPPARPMAEPQTGPSAGGQAAPKEVQDTAQDLGPMGQARTLRLGDFILRPGPGWTLESPDPQRQFGSWKLSYTGSLLTKRDQGHGPVQVLLFQDEVPYSSPAGRTAALDAARERSRFSSREQRIERARIAGVETECLVYDARHYLGGWRLDYLPYNESRVYRVGVTLPDRARPDLPVEVRQLLDTLELASGPTAAAMAAAPPGQRPQHPITRILAEAPRPAPASGEFPFSKAQAGDLAIPASAAALQLPSAKPRLKTSVADGDGDVTLAIEAMRLIQGPLGARQEEQFLHRWASLLNSPSEEATEYFQKLSPLLADFMGTRKLIQQAAREFDQAWSEAVAAAVMGDEPGAREALETAAAQAKLLQSANATLAGQVKRVEALGNPPNPVEARERRRKQVALGLPAGGEAVQAGERIDGLWSGLCEYPGHPQSPAPCTMALSAPWTGDPGVLRVARLLSGAGENAACQSTLALRATGPGGYAGFIGLTPAPGGADDAVLARAYTRLELRVSGDSLQWSASKAEPCVPASASLRRDRTAPPPYYTEAQLEQHDPFSQGSMRASNSFRRQLWNLFGRGWKVPALPATANFAQAAASARDHLAAAVSADMASYRFGRILTAQATSKVPFQEGGVAALAEASPAAARKTADQVDAEAISEKEALIRIIEKNLERDRAEYAAADPGRRKELYLRILDGEANLQAERDMIAMLRGGLYVHTRTARDDYQRDLMISMAYEQVARIDESRRVWTGLHRLAGLGGAQEGQLRDFIARNLTHADVAAGNLEKIRKVAAAVGNTVQGANEAEAARQLERAVEADQNLFYAQTTKVAAGMALVAFAPGLCAELGVSAAAAGSVGVVTGAAFGGVTGALEGGPVEAVKQAAAMSSLAGMVAAEAVTGYQEAGLKGAGEKAAVTLLLGKFVEYGASKAGGMLARLRSATAAEEKVVAMTVQEWATHREVQAELARGRKLLEEYRALSAQMRAAQKPGATPESLQAFEQRLLDKAAELNSSYAAKLAAKQAGRSPEGAALQREVADGIDRLYAKRVDRAFFNSVDQRGYQWQELNGGVWKDSKTLTFREIRNASSRGTVNMDRDLALVEMDLSRARIVRDGKPVTMDEVQKDLQKIYEEVYRATTKQDPQKAFQQVTTSVNPESYKQLTFTDMSPANLEAIQRGGWAQQAADVGRVKVWHSGDPGMNPALQLIENARAAAKEIDKRLAPMMKMQGADPARIRYWKSVQEALNLVVENPVAGQRLLRARTGTASVAEAIDQIGTAFEAAVKLAR